ncbi:DNA-3-methyladenine glycosylase 2 family protein [Flavihumibacter sp. CACIAM 22H1]|uniref:DNA-3-methyladenine glycosylase family protein n=1 Tax=Flavihumibacter sp. CACIAM 22H1 TaxID=1812911 RepID=UPI0007A8C376|nr:DNA-3-methyladenine glycosylase 2 family protein [Flavihumibacter sp. CACIAM 22H1]KYP15420.1 MAG: 3-methyladenine DNA glycosylase [Flavihumibacter sp. CACIAM 22H1]
MAYLTQLSLDKKMASILDGNPYELKKQKRIDFYLCSSIMSQQLSVKVAAVIKQRFLALYEGALPVPQQILDTPFETLRGIGLSNAKVNYIQNVARFALEQGMEWKKLDKLSNEEIISYLTQIKGVGRWTVEMLLMFAMGREDVFAVDDLGIQMAMKKLYKLDDTDKKAFKEKMQKIAKKWSPYRTYACIHLWKWKDNGPAV